MPDRLDTTGTRSSNIIIFLNMVANFPYTVLIVDDSPEDRVMYRRYLSWENPGKFELLEATSIQEALKICDRTLPDLILLDYWLPDDDGLVLLREWQERYSNADQCAASRNWQEWEVDLMQQIATQLAIAIQQSEMYERVEAELYERVQSELRERQRTAAEFRALVEHAPDIIFRINRDLQYLYFNPAIEQFLLQSVHILVGKNAWDLGVSKDIILLWQCVLDQILLTQSEEIIEHPFPHQDSEIWFQTRIVPEFNETGEIHSFLCIARDISDRKRNEAALQLQAQMLDQIHDAVISTELDGTILSWNRGAEKLFGYRAEEVIGKTVDLLYENPTELTTRVIEPLLEKDTHEVEVQTRSKSGQLIDVSLRLSVIRDSSGNPVRLIGCSNDISERIRLEAERKRAQQALQTSERRYATLAAAAPVGIYRTDANGDCLYVNDRWCEIAGLTPEMAAGTGWMKGLHPDDLDKIGAAWYECTKTGEKFCLEYRFQRPDGSVIWVYGQAVQEKDTDGNITGYIGTITDISELKKAEITLQELNQSLEQKVEARTAELRASEMQIRAVVEAIPDLLLQVTHDGTCLSYIQSPKQPNEFLPIQQHLSEVLPPALLEQQLEMIQRAIDTGELQVYEHQLYKHDRLVYEEVRIIAISSTKALIIVRDVTERRQVEEQLRSLSARLMLALESGRFGSWEYDFGKSQQFWDDRMYTLYGIQPDEFSGTLEGWLSYIHPDDLKQMLDKIQQVLQSQTDYDAEFRIIHATGAVRYVKACGTLQRNEQHQPVRMIGLNYDITELKLAEEKLREVNNRLTLTNAELHRATRSKDEFLANMSHELRTPLNAILGMSEVLEDEILGTLNDRQKQAASTIYRSGKHLLDLINDILDLAKVESGKLELQFSSVNIDYLCTSSLSFVRQQATLKNIQLLTELPFNLPAIIIDELRIRQVLINLLSNAVKFTPEGGTIKLSVKQELSQEQSFLCFQVIDSGIGIAAENIGKLFQPFIQIESQLNRKHMGTGLGLSLARRLVELHEGKVTVTSELNQGSCFSIYLPYKQIESSIDSERHPNQGLSDATEKQKQDLVITSREDNSLTPVPLLLLVEDNEANISMVSSYLEGSGYRLLLARNGEEAITLATKHLPDLILMDIQMPEIDGFEAISRLRQYPELKNTPIIAVTALVMRGDREKCLSAGANDYMAKPLKLKQLVNLIQHWLP